MEGKFPISSPPKMGICGPFLCLKSFPQWFRGKESACNAGAAGDITWKRAWQPTPVFLPGESCGQKSLAGYSPQGHRESDTTEVT